MLRLSRDRLLVSLAPDSVALARVCGMPRPRLVHKRALECDPAYGTEAWQGAVAALAAAIEPLRAERLDVTIVLSNHFARYAIVPFDAAIAGPEEDIAFARFHFTRIHGERARSWDVRLDEDARGAGRLASAVDAELIQAIRAIFPAGNRMRLRSIQPYLMSAFNLWRASIEDEDAWLLLVEPRRTCLALISNGAWAAVQSPRGEFPSPASWAGLLDREQLRVDSPSAPRKVHVHAPASPGPIAAGAHGWNFLGLMPPPLDGFLPLDDGPLAMALTSR